MIKLAFIKKQKRILLNSEYVELPRGFDKNQLFITIFFIHYSITFAFTAFSLIKRSNSTMLILSKPFLSTML